MSTVIHEGTEYTQLTDTAWADAPYSVRIQVGRELSPEEANQLAALVGYAYAKTGGERGNGFEQDSPNSIIYFCDTTKGRAYNRLETFFEDVKVMAVEGSPPRKTKGNTRLVEGLGDVGEIVFFADSVYDSAPKPPAPTHGSDGFDANGFDSDGYDRYGYDSDGYGAYGYNDQGVNRDGYDRYGYDSSKYDTDDESPPTSPDLVQLDESGNPAPGIYTVDEKVFRVGKTARDTPAVSTFMGGKWRPQYAAESRDTASRIKSRGHKTPVEQVATLGRASGVCLVCGRALSDPGAIERGIGSKCVSKV